MALLRTLSTIAILMTAGAASAAEPRVLRDGELHGQAAFVETGDWDSTRVKTLVMILDQPRCIETEKTPVCGRWVQVRVTDPRKLAELRDVSSLTIAARFVAPSQTDIGDIVAENVTVKSHGAPGVIDYF
jgi:hypothetical protein